MRCSFWKVDTHVDWACSIWAVQKEPIEQQLLSHDRGWTCAPGGERKGKQCTLARFFFPAPRLTLAQQLRPSRKQVWSYSIFLNFFKGLVLDLTCICCTLCVFLVVWDLFCFSQPFTFFCECGLRIWRLDSYSTASFVEILRGTSEFCLFINHSHTGLIYPYHSFTWCAYPDQFTGG
jgi:hypothetical protein